MIEINGKVYRNLQEQVGYISDKVDTLTKQLPYNGPYDTLDDIPDDQLVDNGTYLIGTQPYTIYKYDENTEDFTSLGLFGAKGDKGDTGATGAQGPVGPAAGFGTITSETNTIASGEDASVTVEASGTSTAKDFAFTFNIPQGPQGEQGIQGPQGDPVTITLGGVVYTSSDGNITLPTYPVIPANYATTNTDQNMLATKTFLDPHEEDTDTVTINNYQIGLQVDKANSAEWNFKTVLKPDSIMLAESPGGAEQDRQMFIYADSITYGAIGGSLRTYTFDTASTGIARLSDIVVPAAPAVDGTYTLKVTVADGEATYSWVLDN